MDALGVVLPLVAGQGAEKSALVNEIVRDAKRISEKVGQQDAVGFVAHPLLGALDGLGSEIDAGGIPSRTQESFDFVTGAATRHEHFAAIGRSALQESGKLGRNAT